MRVTDFSLIIKNASLTYDHTPCIEERGYYGFLRFEEEFASKAREESLQGIERSGVKAKEYVYNKSGETIFQIDASIQEKGEVSILYGRLYRTPASKFENGSIEVKVHIDAEHFDTYI